MKKSEKAIIKLQILPGMANPSPPIGPAIGQHGVNIMDFCKQFNNKTRDLDKTISIPVVIKIYSDKSFSLLLKSPVTTALLKKLSNIKKGSDKPGKITVGYIKKEHIEEIAKIKKLDMTGKTLQDIMESIIGTAKSIGLVVKD